MDFVLFLLPVAMVAIFVIHRVLLWMEKRGWIYYKSSGSGASMALNNIHALLHPSKEHVIVQRDQDATHIEYSQSGAPPDVDGDDEPAV